jgi:hypothetical protein
MAVNHTVAAWRDAAPTQVLRSSRAGTAAFGNVLVRFARAAGVSSATSPERDLLKSQGRKETIFLLFSVSCRESGFVHYKSLTARIGHL